MANDVEKLIQDLRSLSPSDRREVLASLHETPVSASAPNPGNAEADEAYQKLLVDAGLIDEVRLRRRDQRSFERFQPVMITGEPLSQTIVEERR